MSRYIVCLLCGLVFNLPALADSKIACSREAIDQFNNKDQIEIYIDFFSQKNRLDVIEQLELLDLSPDFKKKYQPEMDSYIDDYKYQPSESFCLDSYKEIEALNLQAEKIAKENGYQ